MRQGQLVLKKEEQVAFGMRALFEQYGYRRFEMSKFEEYDFYAENRSFLGSESILTFTGLDGKLLALKPDVTLSIVKNTKGSREAADRVYYNENVYRARKGDGEYREILQAGLEYIGEVDRYAVLEVVLLAAKSLELISDAYLLDISHMGFVMGLLDETGLGLGKQRKVLNCIREKNAHEIRRICTEAGVPEVMVKRLEALSGLYGKLSETLPAARELIVNERTERAWRELFELSGYLKECGFEDRINLDFSIINDMDYYNGIMFQGFVDGVPSSILSGGRYDNLVGRLGKNAEAIGFAVYLDLLSRFGSVKREYDTDVLLLYDREDDPAAVARAAEQITANGESVMARQKDSGDIRYRRILDMRSERMGKDGQND